jgi:hypothetical protein
MVHNEPAMISECKFQSASNVTRRALVSPSPEKVKMCIRTQQTIENKAPAPKSEPSTNPF